MVAGGLKLAEGELGQALNIGVCNGKATVERIVGVVKF
jgi:hypothetical protein